MDDETFSGVEPEPNERPSFTIPGLIVLAGLVILATFLGYWMGARQTTIPSAGSAEVGFARDMLTHHAQAVDMATLIRDRSQDETVRQVALDMILTQQNQIGQMQAWLNLWEHPVARVGAAMEWMDMPTGGLMPGMAAPEQLNELRSLQGIEADGLFLQLMIAHHYSGVGMAEAILARSDLPQVRALAQSIVAGQQSEIDLMEGLLVQKGFDPVPAPMPMPMPVDEHGGEGHP